MCKTEEKQADEYTKKRLSVEYDESGISQKE